MSKLNSYEKTMLNAIIFTAQELKENEDDIVSALDTMDTAIKELYKSEFYNKQKLNEE